MIGIAGGGAVAAQAPQPAIEYLGRCHARACAACAPRRQGCVSPLLKPLHYVAGLALPPRCPGCGAVMTEDHRFCAACFGSLRFLGPPWCAGCNLPFEHDRGEGALCGECLAHPPRHAGVRAAVAYGDVARTVALRLKYGGRTAFAETVARTMARLMPEGAELLAPVPLHRWRIWSRGFNQAALIAQAVSRASGVPTDPYLLRRVKATPPLRGLGARGRAEAVAGAFRVMAKDRVAGRAVVLIDDVHTSGATSDGCTAVLRRAGAASVTILCWARVLADTSDD
jgi:ComF family protein